MLSFVTQERKNVRISLVPDVKNNNNENNNNNNEPATFPHWRVSHATEAVKGMFLLLDTKKKVATYNSKPINLNLIKNL